jgi:hypothetical protein
MDDAIQKSSGNGSHGVSPERLSPYDEAEISKAAKLLVDEHGRDGDIVAAQRADAMLREGNTTEGTRWLRIFERIAMSYLSRVRQSPRGL